MKEITDEELVELFIDTLQSGSSKILIEDDETIEYKLFEDFDLGIVSFLHEKSLNRLLAKGFINEEIRKLSLLLREKALLILKQENRNAETVKTNKNWVEILYLSDQILDLKSNFDKSRR